MSYEKVYNITGIMLYFFVLKQQIAYCICVCYMLYLAYKPIKKWEA